MHVVVVGAGIGGLTLTAALQQRGIQVSAYEQAPALGEVGAGLSLWPNALAALDRIGLSAKVRAAALELDEVAFRSRRGADIVRLDRETIQSALGGFPIVIHRADLQQLLFDHVGRDTVHLGALCVGVGESRDAATARLAGSPPAVGDLVVGCDGIDSAVRASTAPGGSLRYAGYTSWRGVTEFEGAAAAAAEYWGRGQRFGIAKMTKSRMYWFAVQNKPPDERQTPAAERVQLLADYADWPDPIPSLVEATRADSIVRSDLYDRRVPRGWSTRRTTLLGDAIHPMTPNLGQGACQAVEDAVTLADVLATSADLEVALRAYEARRRRRVRSIVKASRSFGVAVQLDNAVACWLRDAAVRLVPSRMVAWQLSRAAGANAVRL